jgi:hypothetical protein
MSPVKENKLVYSISYMLGNINNRSIFLKFYTQ